MTEKITPEMRVASVLRSWPQTYEVFRQNGCPDMRRGVFALTARLMKLAWAARVHRIPVEKLLRELNAVVEQPERH
jgi:hypothetical protein